MRIYQVNLYYFNGQTVPFLSFKDFYEARTWAWENGLRYAHNWRIEERLV